MDAMSEGADISQAWHFFFPKKAPGLGLQFRNFHSDWKDQQTFERYWCCSWEKLPQSAQTLSFSEVYVECGVVNTKACTSIEAPS